MAYHHHQQQQPRWCPGQRPSSSKCRQQQGVAVVSSGCTSRVGMMQLLWLVVLSWTGKNRAQAFQSPSSARSLQFECHGREQFWNQHQIRWQSLSSSSSLQHKKSMKKEMAYRTCHSAFLPPGGGGGGNNKSELGDIAKTALSFVGILAFFISPLGGIFFALFNSVLVLAILLPVGALVAFNVWSALNTVTGPCPNCGATVRAPKDESPSLCFSCGAVVQSRDGDIFIASNKREGFGDLERESNSPFSIFENLGNTEETASQKGKPKKTNNNDVIDVEVEKD